MQARVNCMQAAARRATRWAAAEQAPPPTSATRLQPHEEVGQRPLGQRPCERRSAQQVRPSHRRQPRRMGQSPSRTAVAASGSSGGRAARRRSPAPYQPAPCQPAPCQPACSAAPPQLRSRRSRPVECTWAPRWAPRPRLTNRAARSRRGVVLAARRTRGTRASRPLPQHTAAASAAVAAVAAVRKQPVWL